LLWTRADADWAGKVTTATTAYRTRDVSTAGVTSRGSARATTAGEDCFATKVCIAFAHRCDTSIRRVDRIYIAVCRLASNNFFGLPVENWRRPPGRPRTTWMKNIPDDLSSLDLGIHEARDLAQDRPLWRLMSLHSAARE